MARDDSSKWGRAERGRSNPNRETGVEHDYGYSGSEEADREREGEAGSRPQGGTYGRVEYPGAEGPQYRGSWSERRGGFGEREYGQRDQREYGMRTGFDPRRSGNPRGIPYGQEPGFRERIYAWPREHMGMRTNMPYYGGSQYGSAPYGGSYPQPWGGAVGFGSYLPGQSPYDLHPFDIEVLEEFEYERRGPPHPAAYGQPSMAGRGPKGYKRSDDRIHEEICERLTRDPWIDATEIEVKVKDGEVKLEGHVHERRLKHMVEDAVASVSGVREIKNGLKVERHHPGFKGEVKENGREFEGTETRVTRGRVTSDKR